MAVQQLNNVIKDPGLFLSLLCHPQKIRFALKLAPFIVIKWLQ